MTKAKLQFLKRLVMSDTDFQIIHQSLKATESAWIFDYKKDQVPTVGDLQHTAKQLLDSVIEKADVLGPSAYYIKGSGGFVVTYYGDHFPAKELAGRLSLTFNISNVSLSYRDVAGEHHTEERKTIEDDVSELKDDVKKMYAILQELKRNQPHHIQSLSD